MLRVAGIDLSGRTVGRTALAWLEGERRQLPRVPEPVQDSLTLRGMTGDETLTRALLENPPALVALDAPLALPHPVMCSDPDCGTCFPDGPAPLYGTRQLDRKQEWSWLTSRGPMPTVMISAIAFRGMYLRRVLTKRGIRVIETWPMGVYRVLQQRAQTSTSGSIPDSGRFELLASTVQPSPHLTPQLSRDQLDAVAAAYAAWCHETRRAHAVTVSGFEDEGAIWIPASPAQAPGVIGTEIPEG